MTGQDELRWAVGAFAAMNTDLKVNPEKTLLAGDTALVTCNWTMKARDPEGNDIEASGRFADVVRRQPDGDWLFVIDNPNGSD